MWPAYAGYPHLLSDNSYSKGFDTLVTSTSNAMLLSSDLARESRLVGWGRLKSWAGPTHDHSLR